MNELFLAFIEFWLINRNPKCRVLKINVFDKTYFERALKIPYIIPRVPLRKIKPLKYLKHTFKICITINQKFDMACAFENKTQKPKLSSHRTYYYNSF